MELRPGYKRTELGVIPEEWTVSNVGSEFDIQLGKMLDAEKNAGTPKPYLGNRSVQWGNIDTVDLQTMRMSPSDLQRFRLRRGDLLVCEGGEVGRSALWADQLPECYYQKALHRLRPLNGFNPRLMLELLRFWVDHDKLGDFVSQTSIAHLTKEKFEQVPMPVPPVSEQRAIATALSDVDALLTQLDRLIAKKRDIKQAAMQQLLTGKTRLPGFEGEWRNERLGSLATFFKGKGLPKDHINEFEGERCIHYGELFTYYSEIITEVRGRTAHTANAFRSEENDVLMPTSDVTPTGLAKASCVRADGIILGGDILVIRADKKRVHGSFLSYLIRNAKEQILQLVTGTTVFHLYGKDMAKFNLCLPSLAEQSAVVDCLHDLDAELATLETRRDKTRALKKGMMQELLTGRTRLV